MAWAVEVRSMQQHCYKRFSALVDKVEREIRSDGEKLTPV
jgi:hypothetical protein